MYKSLNADAIGIKNLPLPDLIELARATGFAGVDFDMREALTIPVVADLFLAADIRPAQWGLPVNGTQTEWDVDLTQLAACARLGAELGSLRVATWVPSWSDSRDLASNTAFHIERLIPVAKVLGEHGCALGLEFLGPATLLNGHPHPFIRTMDGMLDMARQIGPNVGLLLDVWHLFTSGGTLAQIAKLKPADIVHVHINDAPVGVPFDQVLDNARFVPLETGVLDLAGFMQTLAAIGYDGPITTEPFNARLNAIAAENPEAAAREVSAAMDRLWEISGLAVTTA